MFTKACVVLFCLSSGSIFAQWQEAVTIKDTDLRLGMHKTEVIRKLRAANEVKEVVGDSPLHDAWCIRAHDEQTLPWDCDFVHFDRSGLLNGVNKRLGSLESDAAARLLSKLCAIVASAEKAGITVTVHTQEGEIDDPLATFRGQILSFSIGTFKTYDLAIVQPIGTSGAGESEMQFTENLFQRQSPIKKDDGH